MHLLVLYFYFTLSTKNVSQIKRALNKKHTLYTVHLCQWAKTYEAPKIVKYFDFSYPTKYNKYYV